MTNNKLVLKNRISIYRKEKKLNQTELANMIGTSRQTVSYIENATYTPSIKLALLISLALDVEVEKLFYF